MKIMKIINIVDRTRDGYFYEAVSAQFKDGAPVDRFTEIETDDDDNFRFMYHEYGTGKKSAKNLVKARQVVISKEPIAKADRSYELFDKAQKNVRCNCFALRPVERFGVIGEKIRKRSDHQRSLVLNVITGFARRWEEQAYSELVAQTNQATKNIGALTPYAVLHYFGSQEDRPGSLGPVAASEEARQYFSNPDLETSIFFFPCPLWREDGTIGPHIDTARAVKLQRTMFSVLHLLPKATVYMVLPSPQVLQYELGKFIFMQPDAPDFQAIGENMTKVMRQWYIKDINAMLGAERIIEVDFGSYASPCKLDADTDAQFDLFVPEFYENIAQTSPGVYKETQERIGERKGHEHMTWLNAIKKHKNPVLVHYDLHAHLTYLRHFWPILDRAAEGKILNWILPRGFFQTVY